MDRSIAKKILQLNAEFYQTFANQFSITRRRIQPGVRKILNSIDPAAWILDLGCGNGELARELAQRGFNGQYVGLDFSEELLNVARQGTAGFANFYFIQGNLANPEWQASVMNDWGSGISSHSVNNLKFTTILAFAALHHIPGREAHLQILKNVRRLLTPNGRFIHSNWQFIKSERLRKRIHPWSEIGINNSDVGPGDYLIDWRRGGFGLRYVHLFSEDELSALAEESGFYIIESFYSDGETGDLGLYQIWEIGL